MILLYDHAFSTAKPITKSISPLINPQIQPSAAPIIRGPDEVELSQDSEQQADESDEVILVIFYHFFFGCLGGIFSS